MDGWLGVRSSRQGDPIEAYMTTANRNGDGLKAWNLCSMAATNLPNTATRKCERLLFKFKDPMETERFDTTLLKCHLRRSEKIRERNLELIRLADAFRPGRVESPISPRSSILSVPPMRQSQTFATFPVPSATPGPCNARRPPITTEVGDQVMTSALHNSQRAQITSETFAGRSVPVMSPALRDLNSAQFTLAVPRSNSVPQIKTVIPGYRLELQTDRPVREVHGNSMPTQELPVSQYRQWGG